jgi:simple sugar transport system permease protein
MSERSINPIDLVKNINHDRLDILVRRFERLFSFLVPVLAVLAAMVLISVLISSLGQSSLEAYKALFVGSFGNIYDIANSLNRAAPLILVGLGVAIAFRGGVFNIGGEGQIMMGGLLASVVGIYFTGLPGYIHLPLTLLAGFIGGAIWGLIPGYFYAKHGTNLIITTIMLNDIALGIISTLVKGPMVEPPGYYPQTAMMLPSAILPLIWPGTRLHAGLIIAVSAAVLMYILLFHTPLGFEIRTVGENAVAAKHAGINVFRNQIMLMLISGGLGGLAGTVEILGAQYRLRALFLPNYGYEALAVAILAQKNPLGVIISGLLFGALKAGAGSMQRATNLPMSLVSILGGVIILFVIASGIMMGLPRYLAKKQVARMETREGQDAEGNQTVLTQKGTP